jgi:hypothetical protein
MNFMPHRFQLGDVVASFSPSIPPGPYVVVRLLPLVGSEPHYRVKSRIDGHERALLEGQIMLVGEPAR